MKAQAKIVGTDIYEWFRSTKEAKLTELLNQGYEVADMAADSNDGGWDCGILMTRKADFEGVPYLFMDGDMDKVEAYTNEHYTQGYRLFSLQPTKFMENHGVLYAVVLKHKDA